MGIAVPQQSRQNRVILIWLRSYYDFSAAIRGPADLDAATVRKRDVKGVVVHGVVKQGLLLNYGSLFEADGRGREGRGGVEHHRDGE